MAAALVIITNIIVIAIKIMRTCGKIMVMAIKIRMTLLMIRRMMTFIVVTTRRRSVNARCPQTHKYAEAKKPGKHGLSGSPAQQKILSVRVPNFRPSSRKRAFAALRTEFLSSRQNPIFGF